MLAPIVTPNRAGLTRFAAFLAAVLTLAAASSGFASKADELLQDANKAADKARAAKSTADRRDSLKKAAQLYTKVEKDYPDTPQGANALYNMAVVNRDVSERLGKKEKPAALRASYDVLKQLVNIYDKPQAELEEKLTSTEARDILRVVESGKKLKDEMAAALDKGNSTSLQYKIIDALVSLTGRIPGFSYWFAIVLVTVIVKVLITPLTKAQFKAMKEMQKVGPLVKGIQEKYKGDQKTIGEKTMELYKEHKINPFASCLPLLVQMPILMGLYYTIRSYEFQFAHGTFLWIGSGLSHLFSLPAGFTSSPGSLVWVTARNLSEPDLILVVLYVISMYISTKMSAVDPTQAEQQKMMAVVMPVMFAFIFASFPSAFLLYWLVFNILQTTQQYMILHGGGAEGSAGTPPPAPAAPDDASGEGSSTERIRRRRRRR